MAHEGYMGDVIKKGTNMTNDSSLTETIRVIQKVRIAIQD